MELLLNLHFHEAAAPAVGNGLADIKLPHGRLFDHLEQADDVAPGQLRNRLFRNFTRRESQGQQLHGQQIASRQPLHARKGLPQVGGQAVNHLGSPALLLLTLENDLAGLPIGSNNHRIRRQSRADPGLLEVPFDFL